MPTLPDPKEVFASSITPAAIVVEPFGELTSADEIRAVFGLSDAELPDEMLTQRVYLRKVSSALGQVDAKLLSDWATLSGSNPALLPAVENFALYCIADQVCDVLPLVAARTLSDSKSTFQRFDLDIQGVIANIRQRYAVAAQTLQELLVEESTSFRIPVLFGSGTPTYDPVVGDS